MTHRMLWKDLELVWVVVLCCIVCANEVTGHVYLQNSITVSFITQKIFKEEFG